MVSSIEPEYRLSPVECITLRLTDDSWSFAENNVADIAHHWAEMTAANPTLFNGKVLLMANGGLTGAHFEADLIEVDYASFITWRDWGWCDKSVHDCYGCAVLVSSDGALIMGRMASHTVNGGLIYPPGGSLTREDLLADGSVDMIGSIARELAEETGLAAQDAEPGGFYLTASDQRLAIGQVLRFAQTAQELAAQVNAHIRSEDQPELSEAIIMRKVGDVDPKIMPPHARALSVEMLENTSGAL